MLNYHQTTFLTSAPSWKQLPLIKGAEVAFIGRSNAGKSSALNTLTGQKNLARTSKIPGRTQLLNLFRITESAYLVDLPGYGYARLAKQIKNRWQEILYNYLQWRQTLCGLVLLMDIRHPLKALDLQLIQWATRRTLPLPLLVLLTKADKLAYGAFQTVLREVRRRISTDFDGSDIQVEGFSSLKRWGVEPLQKKLDHWLLMVAAEQNRVLYTRSHTEPPCLVHLERG